MTNVSYVDLIHGRVPPAELAGKIVVVGPTSPALQDSHSTSVTSSTGMSGPELQAGAIATALAGNPLRQTPLWVAVLITVLAGLATPLSCLTIRPARALVMGAGLAVGYTILCQIAFQQGLILPVSYPLVALAIGTLGALLVSYLAESWERELSDRYGAVLEDTVRERTAELYDTQVEVIRRLAQAAELRDDDTGAHIDRVGRICERVARQMGMAPREAERLRIASTLHDVGKIGVADRVLLKRGELDSAEWDAMMAHTTAGAALLSGSSSPLLQMAEVIARTHHERWDGTGYPEGLKGDQIPLVGRICAICDVFDALASRRSYKDPWAFDRVVREIERKRGSHFDPRVVDAFLKVIDEFRDEAWDRGGASEELGAPAESSPVRGSRRRGRRLERRRRRQPWREHGRRPRRGRDRGAGDRHLAGSTRAAAHGACPARTARRRGRARRAASRRPRAAASTSSSAASAHARRAAAPTRGRRSRGSRSRCRGRSGSARRTASLARRGARGRARAGRSPAGARGPCRARWRATTSPPMPATAKGGWVAVCSSASTTPPAASSVPSSSRRPMLRVLSRQVSCSPVPPHGSCSPASISSQ